MTFFSFTAKFLVQWVKSNCKVPSLILENEGCGENIKSITDLINHNYIIVCQQSPALINQVQRKIEEKKVMKNPASYNHEWVEKSTKKLLY